MICSVVTCKVRNWTRARSKPATCDVSKCSAVCSLRNRVYCFSRFCFALTSSHSLCSVSPSVCFLWCDAQIVFSFAGWREEDEIKADLMARERLPVLTKVGRDGW